MQHVTLVKAELTRIIRSRSAAIKRTNSLTATQLLQGLEKLFRQAQSELSVLLLCMEGNELVDDIVPDAIQTTLANLSGILDSC